MGMHKKRFHFFREIAKRTQRLFRARNIIIVSDQTLDHVPLSGAVQVLVLVGLLGFFSGVSYLTGSYMNARNVIREKEKTIVRTRIEKTHISEEMDTLRKDIASFSRNNKALGEASKQMNDKLVSALTPSSSASKIDQLFTQGGDKLSLRVAYLENHIKEMEEENDRLISAIRARTGKKIDLFEDIIAKTGLDVDRLETRAAKTRAATSTTASSRKQAESETSNESEDANAPAADGGQGGPYISFREGSDIEDNRVLLASVDRLVILHNIIEQLPLDYPIDNAEITSGFGRRTDPFNGRLSIHPGVDLAASYGSKVFATSDGVVVFSGRKAAYGNAVDIEHGFGIVTRYGHLSKLVAKVGEKVKKGQLIGLEGSTGRSTGAHLHYEVRVDDHPVNPMKFLEAGEYVSKE